ncbi:hypothetical protein [Intestinicryptomonas porci]|uniref:Death domain-containing protein n=1 Tax=Intestinicryptomonas porci TaxID=2926320 RepID=A0ABU4WHQ7_9BACT|nr:hypothetical protein [Opitutales bacterium CLA-KB-P66]
MQNYLYTEFIEACNKSGVAPSSWAEQNGLNKTMPTNLKQGVRPSTETLKKLLNEWDNDEFGVKILNAYLKDEIERVGCNLDVIEPIIKGRHSTSTLDDDLKIVAEFLQRRPMRESIHMLSQILKSVPKKD